MRSILNASTFKTPQRGRTAAGMKRAASHAGTWYAEQPDKLAGQLAGWLSEAAPSGAPVCALIAPHAGYSYSGATAAWAYKNVDRSRVRRVFVLGPSHSWYTPRCALSRCSSYATPLGDIPIDEAIYADLSASGLFERMALDVDEREHSIEMHLPFIAHVMGGTPFTLVPILVGALSESAGAQPSTRAARSPHTDARRALTRRACGGRAAQRRGTASCSRRT